MGKVIKIRLDEQETVELYKDGAEIAVVRLDEDGFGQAAGHLSKQNIEDLIELLQECTHENRFYEDIPGSDERISICQDCRTEL
ncbi:hypothetical protein [Planomicrobium okeanokoites]|uniref:hypothetical protein n=1 Tax=Planomicrobium okeanokoites TaxID=244 RepID=UPI000A048747|nr:hypothetical protein [Planomicrobium okeanokoites]